MVLSAPRRRMFPRKSRIWLGSSPAVGLVHDEHLRVVQQRLGHPDALAESPRQLSDGLFHHLIERAKRGHFLDPARQGRRRHFARLPKNRSNSAGVISG